jgi:hypothetical protein
MHNKDLGEMRRLRGGMVQGKVTGARSGPDPPELRLQPVPIAAPAAKPAGSGHHGKNPGPMSYIRSGGSLRLLDNSLSDGSPLQGAPDRFGVRLSVLGLGSISPLRRAGSRRTVPRTGRAPRRESALCGSRRP